MHFSKKASRLWTMFMAVAMCLSLSVPAFAAESPSTEEVSVISSDAQVYSAGNVPVNHRDNPVRGSAVFRSITVLIRTLRRLLSKLPKMVDGGRARLLQFPEGKVLRSIP